MGVGLVNTVYGTVTYCFVCLYSNSSALARGIIARNLKLL
jgi:hypothetical protein